MKKTLYLKFVLAYVIFGFFSFIVVATFSSSLINERVKSENAESLYAEASMVSKHMPPSFTTMKLPLNLPIISYMHSEHICRLQYGL